MKSSRRFFVENIDCSLKEIFLSDVKIMHQIQHVLRLKKDDCIVLLDNTGYEYEACIQEISSKQIQLKILSKKESIPEVKTTIHLYQSLLKNKEKFELVLQKGTEIGVKTFIPLRTERCECKGKMNQERLVSIIKEACEQSLKGRMPSLKEEQNFMHALQTSLGTKVVLDPSGENIHTFLKNNISQEYSLFIGPEGGFSSQEIALAKEQGTFIVSLGKNVLRSETAGIVAPALFLI